MDPSLQPLLRRLEQLSEEFRELRDGVQKAVLVAELDPEMALTRARKVLEYVVRDVYQHRINEPPGTRPLENLLQRLVKDGFFPDRLDAYANTIRKLGNVGTHTFGEKITVADVYQSLTQLMPILEWYFEVEHPEAAGQQPAPPEPAPVKPPEPHPATAPGTPVAVVPKGLRSFDAKDADFFLDLLPGPRDQDGLPESIRFWKHRVEERDEPTFTVGVIYGPSGCGKSSLVKAGLLPRLADRVLPVYVEATANDTEARLLKALRKRDPSLPADAGLTATLAALRQGDGPGNGRKVFIVLDQFEQWLHANRGQEQTELAQALRQCDGERVQCVVMVRDDFWLGLSRFMSALHIELLQGQNIALVDLFDPIHARHVLSAFGRAFGRLPADPSREQQSFLDQAVAGLSQDGRVISVRLALFAEMVKGRPWTPATLREVGGTAGVGVSFLEETFSSHAASPRHRAHERAVRAVLKALLPEQGSDIKGNMQPHGKLLDGIRLRPPARGLRGAAADPGRRGPAHHADRTGRGGGDTSPKRQRGDNTSPKRQRGSVRTLAGAPGRSLLPAHPRLPRAVAARVADAQAARDTPRPGRAAPGRTRRRLVRQAGESPPAGLVGMGQHPPAHPQEGLDASAKADDAEGERAIICCAGASWPWLLAALTFAGLAIRDRVVEQSNAGHAADLVRSLLTADTAQVPAIVAALEGYRPWADPLLRQENEQAADDSRQKLNTALALLPVDDGQVEYLFQRLLSAAPAEVPVLRDALAPHQEGLRERLWSAAEEKPPAGQEGQRLRAASALAAYDPDDDRWDGVRDALAADLVAVPAVYLAGWMKALSPVRERLLLPLAAIFRDGSRVQGERALATEVLVEYAADRPELLADLLMDADDRQWARLWPKAEARREPAIARFTGELDRTLSPDWKDAPLDPSWGRPDAALVRQVEAAAGLVAEALRPVPDTAAGRVRRRGRGVAQGRLSAGELPPLRTQARRASEGVGPRRGPVDARWAGGSFGTWPDGGRGDETRCRNARPQPGAAGRGRLPSPGRRRGGAPLRRAVGPEGARDRGRQDVCRRHRGLAFGGVAAAPEGRLRAAHPDAGTRRWSVEVQRGLVEAGADAGDEGLQLFRQRGTVRGSADAEQPATRPAPGLGPRPGWRGRAAWVRRCWPSPPGPGWAACRGRRWPWGTRPPRPGRRGWSSRRVGSTRPRTSRRRSTASTRRSTWPAVATWRPRAIGRRR